MSAESFSLKDFRVPDGLRFHPEHLWVRTEGATVIVGWTDFSAKTAGDVAFVDLPKVGTTLQKDGSFGSLETGKWVGKLPAPVAGTVAAVNDDLRKNPSQINKDPYGKGWIIKITAKDPKAAERLLDRPAYLKVVERALADMG